MNYYNPSSKGNIGAGKKTGSQRLEVRTCLPKQPANLNSHYDKSYRTATSEGKEVDAFLCERAEGPLGTS